MTRVREIHGKTSYTLRLNAPEETAPRKTMVAQIAVDGAEGPLSVEMFSSSDVEISSRTFTLTSSTASVVVRWIPNEKSVQRGGRSFLAVRSFRPDHPKERCQIHIHYIQGLLPVPPGPVPAVAGDVKPLTEKEVP